MTSDAGGDRAQEEWLTGSRWFTQEEVDRRADEFVATLDRKLYVGSRHHIVPRFILARFADAKNQIYVRDRATGSGGLRNTRDLAVRDFYTFIDKAGELDSSFESLNGEVEKLASRVLQDHLDDPFAHPRPFDEFERMAIDSLVSLQAVRGHSHRRIGEIMADYYVKAMNRQHMSDQDLAEYEFVPHQNDLLLTSMRLASRAHQHLEDRACRLITLDKPLLIICDEPVYLEPLDESPSLTDAELRVRRQRAKFEGVDPEDLVKVTSPRGAGFADAGLITMPVSPRHVLVYEQRGSLRPAPHRSLKGDDALEFADRLTEYAMHSAYSWVAGNPNHTTIRSLSLPDALPAISIIDGNTPMSQKLRKDRRRPARRLDKKARPTTPDSDTK